MEGSVCRPGARIRRPEGSLVDLVRSNLSSEQTARAMSNSVGVSREVFLFARKLVLIKDRRVMAADEEAQVDRAFQILERGDFVLAVKSVEGVMAKYWQKGTRDGVYRPRSLARPRRSTREHLRKNRKIFDVFDRTLFAIRETCSTVDELKIPEELNRDGRDEAGDVLIDSICALTGLLNRIRKDPSHD